MTTVVENPGIPLVKNGEFKKYSTESTEEEQGPSKHSRQTFFARMRKKKNMQFENVGQRLAKRKKVFVKRRVLNDIAVTFAMLGILLMIIETELSMMSRVYVKSDATSYFLKSCITVSTVVLLVLTVWYHATDIQLFMITNSLDDWRLAMTTSRCMKIVLELIVCAIHPIPANIQYTWVTLSTDPGQQKTVTTPADVLLSLPMFLRIYWVCRTILLHSKLFNDASSQSLGALNRLSFNFKFIFKLYMNLNPVSTLTVIIVSVVTMASWSIRICEKYDPNYHSTFSDSLWLIAITFLTVGYGDIVPVSYCGRTIAVLTGIFGAGVTALVVAVLAQKLELSRSEKYVHTFVMDVELGKKAKQEAANVIKQAWMIFKTKKKGGEGLISHQRKLFAAINKSREIKMQQRGLTDSGINLVEIARNEELMHRNIIKTNERQDDMDSRLQKMEECLYDLNQKVGDIHRAVIKR
ncbi:small conductance calcium-activated potassium channel protein 2-like [Lineus longissimus]|uniref:small conductance calcium-activated potassium channel protein 2-like n=1 Tax=Lineus longissimus TaxID=88925 RepID=UPI00315D50BC